jgi:membrane-bound lytic murein transglycosylase B
MLFKSTVAAAAMLSFAATAQAETCGSSGKGFDRFIKEMKREADTAGVSAEAVSVLNTVKYDSSIIKKDRAQNHFAVDFLNFQAGKATVARINKGQAAIAKNQKFQPRSSQHSGRLKQTLAASWEILQQYSLSLLWPGIAVALKSSVRN